MNWEKDERQRGGKKKDQEGMKPHEKGTLKETLEQPALFLDTH